MKQSFIRLFFCLTAFSSFSQQAVMTQINQVNSPLVALAPLRFLASDELMGRSVTRSEINVAARYISEQFRSIGVKEVPGTTDYFQNFEIKMLLPTTTGSITFNAGTYKLGIDLIQANGDDITVTAPVIYAGYGMQVDVDKIDVKGKIVVANRGENDSTPAIKARSLRHIKQKLLYEKGAIALIERYQEPDTIWRIINSAFMQEALIAPRKETSFPAFLLNDTHNNLRSLIQTGTTATIKITGNQSRHIAAKNVMGWVEGTDPTLKNQYVALTSHYDHIGLSKQPKREEGKLDSIYNGATDNALGVAAVLNAARYFTRYPAKRSILLIAYTAEENGLFGSIYFAANPVIPLRQIIYNLNIDNGGYNDTSSITLIGMGRTTADVDIKKAAAAYGLDVHGDGRPGLFERSDNLSLAVAGIPAPKYALGNKESDETITNRYHQLSDEVGNMHLPYILKYMNSYVLATKYIADNKLQPKWTKGDEYEPAWIKLYGTDKK